MMENMADPHLPVVRDIFHQLKMSKKAGIELTTSTIIILVIALLVLVMVLLIATGALGSFGKNIISQLKLVLGEWDKGASVKP